MPIELGKKLVKDLPEQDRVAIGVTLPLQRGNTGYFAQSFQTSEQIKSNIKNLLLTRQGERIMHPTFGTSLYALLFSQNTENLETEIEFAIERAIKEWIPFVNISEIIIDQNITNKDRNIFTVSITFSISGQQNLETVKFNIEE